MALASALALLGTERLTAQDAAPAVPVQVSRADSPQLKDRDHDDLGKLIADYFDARTKSDGVREATDELQKKMAAIAKREKVDTLLNLSSDWEIALAAAKKFPGAPAGKGRLKDISFTGINGDDITYWLHGPKNYKNDNATPLLIIVPDKDQKCDELLRKDWLEQGTGIEDEMILVCTKMPKSLDDWTLLGSKGKPGGIDRVLQVFKEVSKEWNIDRERVFLCGVEDGVATAVRVASLFPDRFAGVIGRSGDPKTASVRNFSNLPMFLAAGSTNATAMANAAEEKGWKHIQTPPSAEVEDIVAWMRGQVRVRHPSEVQLEPLEQFARDAYWVKAEGFETDTASAPWVQAVADRQTNTITVEGSGISQVILYFSDRVVDLDRPVKVVIGGVVHESVIDRSLEVMLERARTTGDAGRAYVAQGFYDFPTN